MEFKGVYTALITPFIENGSKIDYNAFGRLIERQVEAGIAGVVPCGTTGESPTLNHVEHRELIKKTVDIVNGRMKVIAGTGSNSTAEAVELTRHACEDGADAVMLVNPYYNKPSQRGLFEHFKRIAETSTIPVVLYNIRGRTGVNVEISTFRDLLEIKNIHAVKEASGDPAQMAGIQRYCGDRFSLLSGDDNIIPAVMGLGGRGVVSVASNIYPKKMVRMMNFYLEDRFKEGNHIFYQMYELMQALFWETNPVGIKAASEIMGLSEDSLRLPLLPMSGELKSKLKKIIQTLGEDE